MNFGWRRIAAAKTHRELAWFWLLICALVGLVGLTLGLVIRAELAAPGIQLFSNPARYNDAVTMHGLVLSYFFAMPLLAGAFGHLMFSDALAHDNMPAPLVSRVAFYMFAVSVAVFTLMPLLEMVLPPAEQAGNDWSLYPPLTGGNEIRVALPVMVGALLGGIAAVLLSMAGLVWAAVMAGRPALASILKQGGGVWLTVAMGFAAYQLLVDGRVAILLLTGAGLPLPEFGTGFSAGEAVQLELGRPHSLSLAMLLAGMGIVVSIAAKAAGRPGYLWLISLLALVLLLAGLAVPYLPWWEQFSVDYAWLARDMLSARFSWPLAIALAASLLAMMLARPVPGLAMGWSAGFAVVVGVGIWGMRGIGGAGPDMALHDTYYVVAQLHFLAAMAMPFAVFAGLVSYYPAMTGRLAASVAGWVSLVLLLAGSLLTFFPMYWLGLMGMPRRYVDYPDAFAAMNKLSSVGSGILFVAGVEFGVWILLAVLLRKTLH